MADVERRLGGWAARHAAYTVVLAIVFGVSAASLVAYLWLARSTAAGLRPVEQQVGQLDYADGSVRVKRVDSNEFVTAEEGVALGALDTIQTADDAVALIRFGDGTSYRMGPGMTVVLRDASGRLSTGADSGELTTGRAPKVLVGAPAVTAAATDIVTSSGDASSVRRRIDFGTSPSAPTGDQPHRK